MILLENGPGGRPARFSQPLETVIVHDAAGVVPALHRLDEGRAAGLWVAGWLAYEAGYALEPRLGPLMPQDRDGPLLSFGLYAAPAPFDEGTDTARLTAPEPMITRAAYGAAFGRIKDWIAAGDCYQVNLTFPMSARVTGPPLGLYAALRARGVVPHGGFVDLGDGPAIVSRSPELFFDIDAGGVIRSRPMKGTAPRDADPRRDAALSQDLAASPKARAENLMIVDLLRNDIGRIATIGSVRVPELFAVEAFSTVHQMSSTITGRLAGPSGMAALMGALFPCGSITGAPKIRAMEIIRALEPHARGAYCGALGWMAPDGRAAFSVAIRTVSVWDGGRARFGVGGGIVADSTEDGEWEEALWKARFAKAI
ncbi:MAG: aminodeoxychorismate synthase component I [Gemmobacter sp.]